MILPLLARQLLLNGVDELEQPDDDIVELFLKHVFLGVVPAATDGTSKEPYPLLDLHGQPTARFLHPVVALEMEGVAAAEVGLRLAFDALRLLGEDERDRNVVHVNVDLPIVKGHRPTALVESGHQSLENPQCSGPLCP